MPSLLSRSPHREDLLLVRWGRPTSGTGLSTRRDWHADVDLPSGDVVVLQPDEGLDQTLQAADLGDEDGQLASKFCDVFIRPDGIMSDPGGSVLLGVRSERDAFSA